MKKLLIFLCVTLVSLNSINGQLAHSSAMNSFTTGCDGLMQYYPKGNDIVQVRVDFVLVRPSTGPGRFANVTQAECQKVLDSLNFYLSHIAQPSHPLSSPAPFLSTAKIEFVLNAINRPVSDSFYYYAPRLPSSSEWAVVTNPNALNFVFGNNTPSGPPNGCNFGQGISRSNKYCQAKCLDTTQPVLAPARFDLYHNLHEIGHCFNLKHVDLTLEPNVDDYWKETSAQVGQSCGTGTVNSSNNLMTQAACRDYISPKQIAYMHYMLRTTLKDIVQDYGSSGDCNVNPALNYTVAANTIETWTTNYDAPGNIIVENGAHLTISASLRMTAGSKIIVKPTGKLTVNSGCISSMPCGQWQGIEVWGTMGSQSTSTLNPGMPVNNGMVELVGAVIANAEIGVRLGRSSGPNQDVLNTGGGIIQSFMSKFINNKTAVRFGPFTNNTNNVSFFKLDTFIVDEYYTGALPPLAAINLYSVKGVQFLGCYFEDIMNCTSIGIKASNASVRLKDYCNAMTGTGICTGTQTQNNFVGFEYGMRLSGGLLNLSSSIDHVNFDQRSKFLDPATSLFGPYSKSLGGIYIVDDFGTRVTNCSFTNVFKEPETTSPVIFGLYLDNCNGYIVENNYFYGNTTTPQKTGGIFINNSGPASNSIYNNIFEDLNQCIWTQNENYDPLTGAGLKLNCNDFIHSEYNIGVQSLYQGNVMMNNLYLGDVQVGYPAPTQNGGISTTQGVVGPTVSIQKYVRNAYDTKACNSNAENKFYIDVPNPFTIISHGSFSTNTSVYHPLPQTNNSCSSPADIVIQMGDPAPWNGKPAYCANNYLNPGSSMRALLDSAQKERQLITTLNSAYSAGLDGGSTQGLLETISDWADTEVDLKDLLTGTEFLSDTVLKLYFTREGVDHTYLLDVFTQNAPLHPRLWEVVNTIGLSNGEQTDWEVIQFQNKLSPRAEIEAARTMAYNELGLINNERIRRFLNDSAGPVYDSILAIYDIDEIPQSKYRKTDVLIASGNSDGANDQIDMLEGENEENFHFCTLQRFILALRTEAGYDTIMRADTNLCNYLKAVAASNNALVEGYAKALLQEVYDSLYQEIKLQPQPGSSERKALTNTKDKVIEKQKEVGEVKGIKLYPNPASNFLMLEMEKGTQNLTMQIIDVTGNVLLNYACSNSCQIDTGPLQNGLYLVNLYREDILLCVKKIVIIK